MTSTMIKTLPILDPVIIPSLEETKASEWETDDNVPLKKLKCLSVPKAPAEVENTLNIEDKVASEDSLSDPESYSSKGCDSESTSGDEGDDEDDIKTSVDGIINWFEPFKKIIKKPFCGEKPDPTVNLEQETSELNLLMSFLGEHFLDTTASVSNQYVQMYKMKTSHLTTKDITVYMGLRIVMGVDLKSSIDDYWSTDACLVNKFVSTTMSKNLFKGIHRAFHVDDPQNVAQTSALDRVNSLLSNMKTKSKEFFNLHENISIDEAMIKFHGKHSSVVGAPNKPAKSGYKIYTLADGHTGYIWDFEVYLQTAKREEGLTKRVVETLCKDVTGKHHVIYVDKFYTSIPLDLSLLKKKRYISVDRLTHLKNSGLLN
ncbi:PiggyBac transposable element-derived protein 4-like [Plakobranchus ocellatus]|uniref:PiggyBac transposable element-derived protein 4-like n=1 Tax=Plakobranchus ocellatus TaxID=259542 RepID=A0AAV4BX32_9GAST|nr:PiggyBac transposable element-derived protein 4-like [Plakobranchus ocellatus]